MFNQKTLVILLTLLNEPSISLYALSVKTKFSIKELQEQVDSLNDYLHSKDLPELIVTDGSYFLPDRIRDQAQEIIEELKEEQLYLAQNERIYLIYLYTFCRRDFVSNHHYQDFLKVSKNTSLADIKMLREWMQESDLQLTYTRAEGYSIHGQEKDKHRLALFAISQLLSLPIGSWTLHHILSAWEYPNRFEELLQRAEEYYLAFQLTPIQNRLEESLYLLLFILYRYGRVSKYACLEEDSFSQSLQALTDIIIQDILTDFSLNRSMTDQEKNYLSGILSGCFEGELEKNDSYFQALTEAVVEKMEEVSLLNFEQRDKLEEGLKRHLIPAYFRLKYRLFSTNSYTEQIKKSYPDLFELVQGALQPLENEIGYTIPDSEISYFVVHFGGYLQSHPQSQLPYRAVVICPNGVSSSLILKEDLKKLFPKIAFSYTTRLEQLSLLDEASYDLIFSTVEISSTKPTFPVSVLMTEEQAQSLVELVARDFPDACEDTLMLEQLMETIKLYSNVTQETALRSALRTLLLQSQENRKEVKPLLQELITEATYQTSSEILDWKSAIRLAAKPLLDSGQIELTYPEAMIAKVQEFGPFIDLGKGIAIPHARPEDGVNQVGMSMLVLEHPIYLLDDPKHEIRLLICIAAVDNETHLKALSHLTTILRDATNVQALLASKSYSEIKNIIQQEA